MSEHSKDSWTTDGGLKTVGWAIDDRLTIRDANEMPVAACLDKDVMDRIVEEHNALAGVPDPEKLMIAVRKAVDNYVRSQESMTGPFIFPGIDEIAAALKGDD